MGREMDPGEARRQYRRLVKTWKSQRVRGAWRIPYWYCWRQTPYRIPDSAEVVHLAEGDGGMNLDRMRAAVEKLMERPSKPSANEVSQGKPIDLEFERRWPTLWLYMTNRVYSDGGPRQTSSLLLFFQEGLIKGMLKDPDGERCLWMASRGPLGLLDCMEAALAEGQAEWREDRKKTGQAAKRLGKSA